jgi:hypothetical protein
MDTVKITRKQASPVLSKTFPEYRGRTIKVEFTDKVTFYDTNWGGGSRNFYHAVRADGRDSRLVVPAPWVNAIEGKSIELPADVLIVEHTIFCGQDCGITIYAHPTHAPKWLTA